MDNFLAQLGVILKYSVALVGYLGAFGALVFITVVGVVGMWGFLSCIWEEIKMEIHK